MPAGARDLGLGSVFFSGFQEGSSPNAHLLYFFLALSLLLTVTFFGLTDALGVPGI